MKETLKGYLTSICVQAESLLTRRPTERMIEYKEAPQDMCNHNSGTPQQQKATHPASLQKGKKRRIPFVAFAFVLAFTSLCVLSLVGTQTLVSAARASLSSSTSQQTAFSSLDAMSTSPSQCIQTNCYGNPPGGSAFTGPIVPDGCDNGNGGGSTSNFANASPVLTQTICANPATFFWGNLDITCIENTSLDTAQSPQTTSQLQNFNNDMNFTSQGHGFGPWWVSANPNQQNPNQNQTPLANQPHIPPSSNYYNQNTCVPGHQCRSNNGSALDAHDATPTATGNDETLDYNDLADKTGGDNVVCQNEACLGITASDYTGGNDGNVCGSGQAYDKLACFWISNNWYYNPTAYNPDGALEEGITGGSIDAAIPLSDLATQYQDPSIGPMYGLQTQDNNDGSGTVSTAWLQTSGSDPHCQTPPAGGGVGHWTCDSGTRIVLMMTAGHSSYASGYIFQADSTNSDAMMIKPIMGDDNSNNPSGTQITWKYPPTWEVMCAGTGEGGEFPCSDINGTPDVNVIKTDWLSGDPGITSSAGDTPGHLVVTYNADTIGSANLQKIFGITLGLGYLLIGPSLILIGYQLLWASWTLGRANAMEAFGRVILSILAVGVSFTLCQMLLGLANLASTALAVWHQELGYPQAIIAGKYYQYTLAGDTEPGSFRGVVVPVSRWGCIANDFVGILASKLISDISANLIPFIGGFIQLAAGIADAIEFARRIGEFGMLILSINLFAQVVMRIVLINYYILTAPIAFACWGLPAGMGRKVIGQWFKGFISLLSVQAVQVFVLATLPFIIPALPQLPTDSTFGLLQTLLGQVPPLIVLMATIKVPKFLGTGATKAIAQAGTMTAGAVTAAAGAAYNVV